MFWDVVCFEMCFLEEHKMRPTFLELPQEGGTSFRYLTLCKITEGL